MVTNLEFNELQLVVGGRIWGEQQNTSRENWSEPKRGDTKNETKKAGNGTTLQVKIEHIAWQRIGQGVAMVAGGVGTIMSGLFALGCSKGCCWGHHKRVPFEWR